MLEIPNLINKSKVFCYYYYSESLRILSIHSYGQNLLCEILQILFWIDCMDALYFYVATNVWVGYGAPVEKNQRRLNFLQNARYCTVKALQHTKSTQLASCRHRLHLLNKHLCQFGRHASIHYLKRHWHMIQLFWFFDFFPVYTLSPCTNKIPDQIVKIKMSTMEALKDLQ